MFRYDLIIPPTCNATNSHGTRYNNGRNRNDIKWTNESQNTKNYTLASTVDSTLRHISEKTGCF